MPIQLRRRFLGIIPIDSTEAWDRHRRKEAYKLIVVSTLFMAPILGVGIGRALPLISALTIASIPAGAIAIGVYMILEPKIWQWRVERSGEGKTSKQLTAAKAKLNSIIDKYIADNPDKSPPSYFKQLMDRYLQEGVIVRGGATSITSDVKPHLDFLSHHPQHLSWVNTIAGRYVVDGCINQPVAGWSEIVAYLLIAKAKGADQCLEAAKYLIALEALRAHALECNANKGKSEAVEVEAGNVLARAVSKLLSARDGMKPWPGVPADDIAYELTVRSWITNSAIESAYKKAKEVFAMTPQAVLDTLRERHLDTFAQIICPQAQKQAEAQFEKTKLALGMALQVPSVYKVEEAAREAENDGYLVEFNEHKAKPQAQLEHELQALEIQALQVLAETIKTPSALAQVMEAEPKTQSPSAQARAR
jgi:hypothetical protein